MSMNEAQGVRLMEYLDGRLPPDERLAVEEWLAADPEARRLLDEQRHLWSLLGQALPPPAVQASAEFRALTLERAAQERPAALLPMRTRAVALLAASLLVVVVGWAWWSAQTRVRLDDTDRAVVGRLHLLEHYDFLQVHADELDVAVKAEVLRHFQGELPREAAR
jgi:anti-sigma factor RsiW